MPERTSHAPGSFCWPEIAAEDAGKAKAFYAELLGWEMQDAPGGFYTIAFRKGHAVAGLYGLTADQKARKVPPHWLSYVRVDSADSTAADAADLGAKVLKEPFDVPFVGRMAMLEDPTGAGFALWEPAGHEGSGLVDEPGAPCWYELMTRDAAKAKAFYEGLFRWTSKVSKNSAPSDPPYTEFHNGKDQVGGMMEMKGPQWGALPSHWMPYIAVEDCDATARRCAELGGKAIHGPADIPRVGRFAVLGAPDGAAFSVIRLGG